jgi:hypothetical protein
VNGGFLLSFLLLRGRDAWCYPALKGFVYVAREFENTAQNLSLDVRRDIRDQ